MVGSAAMPSPVERCCCISADNAKIAAVPAIKASHPRAVGFSDRKTRLNLGGTRGDLQVAAGLVAAPRAAMKSRTDAYRCSGFFARQRATTFLMLRATLAGSEAGCAFKINCCVW